MEAQTKYYTPTIEEFHVGFEFQMADTKENVIFTENCPYPLEIISDLISRKLIRVKHLDREDIEALGWELDQVVKQEVFYIHITSDLIATKRLVFREKEFTAEIINDKCGFSFYGTIKNKSELKRLMQQLNINESKN